MKKMRDDKWLVSRLEQIWEMLFPEVELKNKVMVKFKGRWKNKFGHIRLLKNKISEIAINGFFKDERVPEYLIDITLAHELVHYMHGFSSLHPKMYRYPHQGGIVNKELLKRGFGHMLRKEKEFLKRDWLKLVKELSS